MGAQAVRLTSVDIDNALNNNHFEVIFQPIFNLSTGALMRMEAFVRWVHPGLGVLPPGAFISFFENQGRMNELTRYVLKASLEQYQAWRGNQGPGFSVNLAFSDLTDPSFPAWLDELLRENRFPAEYLTLECPNPPTNFPAEEAGSLFEGLKQTGVRLAIEIRGRANDVLKEIQPFPFDEVKTGGSAILRFARTVRGGPGLTAISELLELAQAHNACTVAVGVEDQASLQALVSLGFVAAQGNFLAGVGKADAFKLGSINDVRDALSLDPLDDDGLFALMGGKREPVAPEAPPEKEITVEETDDSAAKAEQQAKAKAARAKKRKAQLAAKQRAAKKAAALKAAAEKAEAELVEKQRKLSEAAAQKDAEENARRLQERLTKAYDDPVSEPVPETTEETDKGATEKEAVPPSPAEDSVDADTSMAAEAENAPAPEAEEATLQSETETAAEEDAAPEAGLLLGGSLATAALGHTQPAAAKPEPVIEVEEAPKESTQDITHAVETADTTPEQSSESAEYSLSWAGTRPATPEIPRTQSTDNLSSEECSPWAQRLEVKRNSIAVEQEAESKVQDETADAGVVNPDAPEKTARDYHFVFKASPTAEVHPEPPAEETDLQSEDELLDEVFEGTEELDPTKHHEDPVNESFEFNSTEREIAEKLLRPRKKHKNILQRKYRITHFWPRTWQRKWRDAKARKMRTQEDYVEDNINLT